MNAPTDQPAFQTILAEIWHAAGGDAAALDRVEATGSGDLSSAFAVTDLAAASIAAAGLAVSELSATLGGARPAVAVDRRLASFWFGSSLRPDGWAPPPAWDPIAGDYRGLDGWIRLHTNAPRHRAAALAVLGTAADKADVARAVAQWPIEALESAIVAGGGCAAAMRSIAAWASHPQGRSVAGETLIATEVTDRGPKVGGVFESSRPLAGLKVLDLTRVLAGPVATRFLAGYGAEILRIDPPGWDEPALAPEVMVGKRTARLDLRSKPADHARLSGLLADADILIHGYRSDALARLGFGSEVRRALRPGLVDVALDAYGWMGPWRHRRGFDSLVQMSAGIAEAGMRRFGADRPTPLPVQALDHATGYMMAAAAGLGLLARFTTGRGIEARLSLARTGSLLVQHPLHAPEPLRPEDGADLDARVETTGWGPARRLRPPVRIDGIQLAWQSGAVPIGSHPAMWGGLGTG